jgi:hypothetical protein
MRAIEPVAEQDSVTVALTRGRDGLGDLARLLADTMTYQRWSLRLSHPQWWIGGRVGATTPLLADLIDELASRKPVDAGGPAVITGRSGSGYAGAHWFNESLAAIAALSAAARRVLAEALRLELLGRTTTLPERQLAGAESGTDLAELFRDFPTQPTIIRLADAIDAVGDTHGTPWSDSFRTLIAELDPITWTDVLAALDAETSAAEASG